MNTTPFLKITCRLLGSGRIERIGQYRHIRFSDGTAHVIVRTVGADGITQRMLVSAPPEDIEPADIHFCFSATPDGKVDRLLVAHQDDYFLTLVSFPHWNKKKKQMMGRPPFKELEKLPGFIDLTAEARLAA